MNNPSNKDQSMMEINYKNYRKNQNLKIKIKVNKCNDRKFLINFL